MNPKRHESMPLAPSPPCLASIPRRWSLLTVVLSLGLCPAETVEPYRQPALPIEQRLDDLMSRLNLEEKAQILDHKGPTIQSIQLRSDQWNQCLNGVKWDRPTTMFPTCIAMGATWDPVLVKEIANALSDEARAIYNGWKRDPAFQGEKKGLIYRAPVINISRNPYWGRIHEVFSEDPFLTGRMAVAYVQGLQGDHPHYLKVAATLKHFAVNNVETDRQKLNAVVPERWLHEYWLPHWRDAIIEGKASSVMASYNAINGTPNNRNHALLTDLLKRDWQHEGFVVSDLGGVRTMVEGHGRNQMSYLDAVAQSVAAGCDFSDKEYAKYIPLAVQQGKLSEQRLNDAVRRVLRVRLRLGEFDPLDATPWSQIPLSIIDEPEHRALALRASQQSIVLLQNQKQILPLHAKQLKRVAVIGPHADRITSNNYFGVHRQAVTPLQGLKDRLPDDCEVRYTIGGVISEKGISTWVPETPFPAINREDELKHASEIAAWADVVIVCVGSNASVEHESLDRRTLALSGNQEELVKVVAAANPRTIVVLMSAGPIAIPWLKEHIPAVLQAWWPGEEGGHAIADVLLGNTNPAGRLPYTVYRSDQQVPPPDEYDISKGFTYMYLRGEALYPFGHGLSYSQFDYHGLEIDDPEMKSSDVATIRVKVTNRSTRDGDEVVQLYTRAEDRKLVRPDRELRGFQRVHLQAGETTTVSFRLPREKLALWSEQDHRFVTPTGLYKILIGASSSDIRQQGTIVVHAKP